MRIKEIINLTSSPNTKETLCKDIKHAGIEQGDIVLMHVSLSSIGYILGGVETLYEALLSVIGPMGTLIVPTQTMDNSDPGNWVSPAVPKEWHDDIRKLMPAYNKKTTPTRGMGIFCEYVRNHPNALRSSHPQVSFAAVGYHAKSITKKHSLTPKFGLDTPLGSIYQLKEAKILLIGVDIDKCTALHLSEVLTKHTFEREDNACAMLVDNKRAWVKYQDIKYDSDRFSKIEDAYLRKYDQEAFKVGLATTKVYPFNELVDEGIKYFDQNK